MPVALARIYDRMIHGQVTVGWGQQLRPDLILLANNSIAADAWQQRVYAASVPPEIGVAILSVAEAVVRLAKFSYEGETEARSGGFASRFIPDTIERVKNFFPLAVWDSRAVILDFYG